MISKIDFRPLMRDDLLLVHTWLREPHVKQWYSDDDDFEAIIDETDPTRAYIILADGAAIGYIQTYLIKNNPSYATALDLGTEHAAGMDLFIGNPEFVHKGLGAEIIKKFLKDIVFAKPGVKTCVIGPEPKNTSAIRAYEKAGFRYLKTVQVPGEDELEYIMKIDRKY